MMEKENRFSFLMRLILVLLVIFLSCNKQRFDTSPTGLKFHFIEKKNGIRPKVGEMMRMHLKYRDSKNNLLYDSDELGNAFVLQLETPSFIGGLEEGFAMMGKGDSAIFLVSADSVFDKTFRLAMPPTLTRGELLQFEVRLKEVLTVAEFRNESAETAGKERDQQKRNIEEYLRKNNMLLDPVQEGVYFVLLKEGDGLKPVAGDSVEISYSGTFLSGEIFDASDRKGGNLKYVLGDGKRLLAWEKAISSMNAGAVARLILSAENAYGEQGLGPVPANTPIIYDIKLIKVKPAHPLKHSAL